MVEDVDAFEHAPADTSLDTHFERVLRQMWSFRARPSTQNACLADPVVRLKGSGIGRLELTCRERQPPFRNETAVVVEQSAADVRTDRTIRMAQQDGPVPMGKVVGGRGSNPTLRG
jgi:hypothetical protein